MRAIQKNLQRCGLRTTENLSMVLGGSEDVSYMINRVQERGGQASFMRLLTDMAGPAHNPNFDFDERVLVNGVCALAGYVLFGDKEF
ncbi:MAG: hypothetical protein IKY33_03100 [Clostridia bacterium]|nr:hypothetical protein [Clostridia bacterium]